MTSSLATAASEIDAAGVPWGPLAERTISVRRRSRARLLHGFQWCEVSSAQSSQLLEESYPLPDALRRACVCLQPQYGPHEHARSYLSLATSWAAHARELVSLEHASSQDCAPARLAALLTRSVRVAARIEEDLRELRARCFSPRCHSRSCRPGERADPECVLAEDSEPARSHEPLMSFAADLHQRARGVVGLLRTLRANAGADELVLREAVTCEILRAQARAGARVGSPEISELLEARVHVLSTNPAEALRALWRSFEACLTERAGGELEAALAAARAAVEAWSSSARLAASSQLPHAAPPCLPDERFDVFVERVWRAELDAVLAGLAAAWSARVESDVRAALAETKRVGCVLLGAPAELSDAAQHERTLAWVLAAEPVWDARRRFGIVSLHPLLASLHGATPAPRFLGRSTCIEIERFDSAEEAEKRSLWSTALAVLELDTPLLPGTAPEEFLVPLREALDLARCALAA